MVPPARGGTFVLLIVLALLVPISGLSLAPATERGDDCDNGVKHCFTRKSIRRIDQRLTALVRSDYFFTIYFCAIATVIAATIFIFWERGFLVCSGVISYLLSLATMTLTMKAVYVNEAYNYPKLVSSIHFGLSGLACFLYLAYLRYAHGQPVNVPNLKQAMLIVPVSLAFALSIGAANSALVYSDAGFVEMIASCGPLSTAVVCVIFGMGFDGRLILPVLVVTGGMALCAIGEVKFSWIGFMFALGSVFIRSLKAALQQKILSPVDAHDYTLSPAELLAWMSIPATVWMLIWSIFAEGSAPYPPLMGARGWPIARAILLTCVNAVCLNLAAFFVTKHLGAVGTCIAGNLKGVLLLLGSVAIFGEVITLTQIMGFALQIAGIFWFNKADQAVKEGAAAEKEEKARLWSHGTGPRAA